MHQALGRPQLQFEALDLPLLRPQLRPSRQRFGQRAVPVRDEFRDGWLIDGADDSAVVDRQAEQSPQARFGVVKIVRSRFGRGRVVQLVAGGRFVDRRKARGTVISSLALASRPQAQRLL